MRSSRAWIRTKLSVACVCATVPAVVASCGGAVVEGTKPSGNINDGGYAQPVRWDPPAGYPVSGPMSAVDNEGNASTGTYYPKPLDLYLRNFQIDCQSHTEYLATALPGCRSGRAVAEAELDRIRSAMPAWVWALVGAAGGVAAGAVGTAIVILTVQQ